MTEEPISQSQQTFKLIESVLSTWGKNEFPIKRFWVMKEKVWEH